MYWEDLDSPTTSSDPNGVRKGLLGVSSSCVESCLVNTHSLGGRIFVDQKGGKKSLVLHRLAPSELDLLTETELVKHVRL